MHTSAIYWPSLASNKMYYRNQWMQQKQVVTSLDLAKRDDILPGLRQVQWDLVIVDENFFGLEVELWRIGDSAIAPKFNIISKPNDWIKTVAAASTSSEGEMSAVDRLQFEYWQQFVDFLKTSGSFLKPSAARPKQALGFPLGRSGFSLRAAIYFVYGNNLHVQLVIRNERAAEILRQLENDRAAIEGEVGAPLEWLERSEKRAVIGLTDSGFDPNNRPQWAEQHAWLKTTLEVMYKVFAPRIKTLDSRVATAVDT